MTSILLFIYILWQTNVHRCKEINENANITQLFVHKISPNMLSWNEKEREEDFHYAITSAEGPDVPPWLFVKYKKENNNLYIFGGAPKDTNVETLELQISITSLNSYRTKYFKLKIGFNYMDEYAKNEINLRISNLDIEEMLLESRRDSLIEIFEEHFWKESKGKLYVTYLATSDDAGYPLPLNPNDTVGIVVRLGSSVNFSDELFNLQKETMPLAKHCPSFYKRITVERFFRPKNFIIDWCSFRLINSEQCHPFSQSPEHPVTNNCPFPEKNTGDSTLSRSEELLIIKEAVPQSPANGIITLFIIVPSVCFGLVITSWLSSFMCFNNKKLNDPYSDDYFETIFFVCEEFIRKRQDSNDDVFVEGDADNDIQFHF